MFDAVLSTVTALLEHYFVAHNKLPVVPPLFCNEAPSDTVWLLWFINLCVILDGCTFILFSFYEMKKNPDNGAKKNYSPFFSI